MCRFDKKVIPRFRTGDVIPASMKSTEMEQHLDFYEENAPCFRTGDVIPASVKSTEMTHHQDVYEENSTELTQELEVSRNDHSTMQYKENTSSKCLVNNYCSLYCPYNIVFDYCTVHPSVCTHIQCTNCHYKNTHRVINFCIPHKKFMRGHDTYHIYIKQ